MFVFNLDFFKDTNTLNPPYLQLFSSFLAHTVQLN